MTKRQQGRSLLRIVAGLNPVLRGWFGYFKHARGSTFRALDGFIRRRLRAILRAQEKRPGFGRCADDQRRCPPLASPARFTGRRPKPTPPNAYFATAGLFALDTDWRTARNPR